MKLPIHPRGTNMPFRFYTAAVLLSFVLGCVPGTTTMITRQVNQPLPHETTLREFVDAATVVLTNNGFDIRVANERLGLVTTDWRTVRNSSDETTNTISKIGSIFGGGPCTESSRVFMVQVQRGREGYTLTPKVKLITETQSAYGTSTKADLIFPTKDTPEGVLASRLTEEINSILGLAPGNYYWTEKTIEAGELPSTSPR